MSTHSIKEIREQFKAQGKFHTPPELAAFIAKQVSEKPLMVYDPACGAGSLLAQFPDDTFKYGQDIDQAALDDAEKELNLFVGKLGDTLKEPQFGDMRFDAIVANPPFSVKWEPDMRLAYDIGAPTVPTKSRSDWAFILHILAQLSPAGVASVLVAPGVCFRGQREQQLRAWVDEQNWLDKIIDIPGDTFTDTSIATVLLVFRMDRKPGDTVHVSSYVDDREADVTIEQIAAEDHTWSPHVYLPVVEKEPEVTDANIDDLNKQVRAEALYGIGKTVEYQKFLCDFLGEQETFRKFVADAHSVINKAAA